MTDDSGLVFGIGLSRTGTSSLSAALRSLGYEVVHHPRVLSQFLSGDYLVPSYVPGTGFTDAPIAFAFPHLLRAYPQARFVYTYRDVE